MPNKTVLSDEELATACGLYKDSGMYDALLGLAKAAMAATEQAVLQSPEIQQLRKDAERLDSGCIMTHERNDFGEEYMCERRGIDLRAAIDAQWSKSHEQH